LVPGEGPLDWWPDNNGNVFTEGYAHYISARSYSPTSDPRPSAIKPRIARVVSLDHIRLQKPGHRRRFLRKKKLRGSNPASCIFGTLRHAGTLVKPSSNSSGVRSIISGRPAPRERTCCNRMIFCASTVWPRLLRLRGAYTLRKGKLRAKGLGFEIQSRKPKTRTARLSNPSTCRWREVRVERGRMPLVPHQTPAPRPSELTAA
jgi:hypothetical protein